MKNERLDVVRSELKDASDWQKLHALQEWAKYCVDHDEVSRLFDAVPSAVPAKYEDVEYVTIQGTKQELYLWRCGKQADASHISPVGIYDVAFPYMPPPKKHETSCAGKRKGDIHE